MVIYTDRCSHYPVGGFVSMVAGSLWNIESKFAGRGEHHEKQVLPFFLGRTSYVYDISHCDDNVGLRDVQKAGT